MGLGSAYRHLRRRLRFYRHHTSFELMWGQAYFSQYGEDVFLLEYFKGKPDGMYVDVGGFHPIDCSNTYVFYRSGWRGIVIEPNPEKAPLFRKYRPRDVFIPVAISDAEGCATFALNETASGIVDANYFHQSTTNAIKKITVRTRPLTAIFDEQMPALGGPISILSVDCEGHDDIVLKSNDWARYRPLLVLCEAFTAEGAQNLKDMLTRYRYRHLATCGPTLVFEDLEDRGDRPQPYH